MYGGELLKRPALDAGPGAVDVKKINNCGRDMKLGGDINVAFPRNFSFRFSTFALEFIDTKSRNSATYCKTHNTATCLKRGGGKKKHSSLASRGG